MSDDFDPDEFLGQVAAAKKAPPAPAPAAAQGGDDFDPDEFLASVQPKVGVPEKPSFLSRVGNSFTNFGRTVGDAATGAVKLVSPLDGQGGLHVPFSDLADPAYRHQLERGVSDVVTGGLAEKAANAVDPSFAAAAPAEAAARPDARALGQVGGSFLPSPFRAMGEGAAALVPGKGALASAGRGLAAYEASAVPAAALQAPAGQRLDAALDAATDPAGLTLSAGGGAAAGSHFAERAKDVIGRRAEQRMVDQAIKDIAGSRETGLSKPTDRRIIARHIETLKSEFRDPEAVAIADTARTDPGGARDLVQKRVDSYTKERKQTYDAVDNATGGVRKSELRAWVADEVKRLARDPGQATERQAVETMLKDLDDTWGNQMAPTVPTIKVREYVTKLQRVAADTMGGLEETRRVQILDHLSGLAKKFMDKHLDEAAAQDPGLKDVVGQLRADNKKIAAWLSVEDALKTRETKLDTQNMVDNRKKSLAAGLAAGTAAAHYLHSPGAAMGAAALGAAPYVIPPVDRAVTRSLVGLKGAPPTQANPAAIARLVQAARAGASRAQLERQAQEDGVPPEVVASLGR